MGNLHRTSAVKECFVIKIRQSGHSLVLNVPLRVLRDVKIPHYGGRMDTLDICPEHFAHGN